MHPRGDVELGPALSGRLSGRGAKPYTNDEDEVGLTGTFSNTRLGEKSLVGRVLEKATKTGSDAPSRVFEDPRGPNVTQLGYRQVRLSRQDRDRLIARYESGESVTALARAFGIHRNTVTIHTREARERRSLSR